MLFAAVVLGLLLPTSRAVLYEDQKGFNNWLKASIGHVIDAAVLTSAPIAVLRTADELAAVGLREGSLIWRRSQALTEFVVAEHSDRIVTSHESDLSAWSLFTGQLVWSIKSTSAPFDAMCLEGHIFYILSSGTLFAYSITDGSLMWSTQAFPQKVRFAECEVRGTVLHLAAGSMASSSSVFYISVDLSGSKVDRQEAIEITFPRSIDHVRFTATHLVGTSADATSVCIVSVSETTKEPTCASTRIQSTPGATLQNLTVKALDSGAILTVSSGLEHQLVFVTASEGDGISIKLTSVTASAVSSPFMLQGHSVVAAAEQVTSPGSYVVAVRDLLTGVVLYRDQAPLYSAVHTSGHISQPLALWAVPGQSSDGRVAIRCDSWRPKFIVASLRQRLTLIPPSNAQIRCRLSLRRGGSRILRIVCRSLARATDDTLVFLYQNGKYSWARHEGLGNVVDCLFVELPIAGSPHAPPKKPLLSLADHLYLNFLTVKVIFRLLPALTYLLCPFRQYHEREIRSSVSGQVEVGHARRAAGARFASSQGVEQAGWYTRCLRYAKAPSCCH
jgi:hypothetical protein